MTHRLFVLDVPENRPIVRSAQEADGVSLEQIGPYFVLSAAESIDVDRRSTQARHAVWYSFVGGLDGWRITQWDGDAIRLEPR